MDGPRRAIVRIANKKGLHARASAKVVEAAARFQSQIRISRDGQTVDARSIMGLMMLAASPGTSITVEATGNEAAEVIEALAALIGSRFGEED